MIFCICFSNNSITEDFINRIFCRWLLAEYTSPYCHQVFEKHHAWEDPCQLSLSVLFLNTPVMASSSSLIRGESVNVLLDVSGALQCTTLKTLMYKTSISWVIYHRMCRHQKMLESQSTVVTVGCKHLYMAWWQNCNFFKSNPFTKMLTRRVIDLRIVRLWYLLKLLGYGMAQTSVMQL